MLRAAARSRSPAFDGGSTALLLLIPSLLLTPRCALAQSPSSISAGSSNNSRNYLGTVKFTPSMAVVALMLVTATVFVVVFSLYLLKLFLGVFFTSDSVRIRFAGSASAHSRCSQRLRGLRPEVLETFPTMEYSEVKEQKVTGANECAVCISEFEDDEALRLLPACSHIFHADCIDAWLDSHTTCPVCRVNLAEANDVANPVVLDAVEVGFPGPASAEVQIDVPAAGTNGSQQPDRVSIVVEPVSETEEEEDLQHRMEEAMELAELGSRKRELRSGSRRRPPKFPRCHSTGHSLGNQASGERDGRYTLRLPEHVLREILAAKKLHRSASVAFPNAEDGRSRPGYCYRGAGEGSSGGLRKSTDGRRSSCARSMRGFSHVDEFREDGEGSVKRG